MPDPSSQANLVLAIIAHNENKSLESGSTCIGDRLTARGYRHRIVDMMNPNSKDELKALLLSNQVAFAYGFAGVGSQFTIDGGDNLWTAARIPYLALWYDHPCYNYRQHMVDSPYVIQGYHVRDHLDMRRKYLSAGLNQVAFLPVRFSVAPVDWFRPFKQREHKIIYAKTGINPAAISGEWTDFPKALQDVLWILVETAKKDRNLDLADATAKLFQANNQPIDNLNLFMGAIAAVDAYIRAWRSDRLARALLRFPAHIIGRGWDYLDQPATQAEFFDPISVYDYLERARTYRITANTNPLWRDGVHDRVIWGFCASSVNLTDRTRKSDEIFGGLDNYVGFEWDDNLDDVISLAFERARNDDADFFTPSERVIRERVLDTTNDYISEIEKAVDLAPQGRAK